MKVKFEKGSAEWQLFMGLWNLCQDYWQVEPDNDDYWTKMIADAEKLRISICEATDESSRGNALKSLSRNMIMATMEYFNLMEKIERKS